MDSTSNLDAPDNTSKIWSWVEETIYLDLTQEQKASLKSSMDALGVEFCYLENDRNFYAELGDPEASRKNRVSIGEMGLLSLWFLCVATSQLNSIAGKALRARTNIVSTENGPEAQLPSDADASPTMLDPNNPSHTRCLRSLNLPGEILANLKYSPCDEDWLPYEGIEEADRNFAQLIFERAVAWILLHEIGHLQFAHQDTTTSDLRIAQEYEADQWANDWFEEEVEGKKFILRKLSIGVVMCWLGIIDNTPSVSTTHPHAGERFWKLYPIEKLTELDGGLEALGYIATALFFPNGTGQEIYETPKDTVSDVMELLHKKLSK